MGLNVVVGISEYHFHTTFNVKAYTLWKMEKGMVFLVYVDTAELCLANIFLICYRFCKRHRIKSNSNVPCVPKDLLMMSELVLPQFIFSLIQHLREGYNEPGMFWICMYLAYLTMLLSLALQFMKTQYMNAIHRLCHCILYLSS